MEDLPELTHINCYNVERGKLAASVRWVIGHVYGGVVPDLLATPICYNDNNTFHLEPAVITALTNASLYSNAAAKIFKDQSLINQPHSVVLWALSNHSVQLLISGEEANIDETILSSVQPFHQAAHLAVMDALMTAHMRSIITIERVVTAVQKYTTVDAREEPMDSVDALLFWINKICLLVRDDIEKSQAISKRDENQFGSIVVPEMEDLYEDMCDGACLCALVAFYSDQMNMQRICFNDPMSIPDCQYNLMLLKNFCERLSFNFFYFEIEDILYLHECLQPNVNAFLADLFNYFEGVEQQCAVKSVDPNLYRHFAPIAGIPDLRGPSSSGRPNHFSRSKQQPSGMTRAMSLMSTDSLMSGRGVPSRVSDIGMRLQMGGPDTTNFRQITQVPTDQGTKCISGTLPNGGYERSDSMPAASVRLALEEKRRDLEKKRYLESNQNEAERVQKQKDAFFALMQRIEKANDSRSQTHSGLGSVSPATASNTPKEFNSVQETVDSLKKQLEQLSVQHEELSRQVHGDRRMSHAISQPAIHSDLAYLQDQQVLMDPYNTPLPCMVNSCVQPTRQPNFTFPYTAETVFQPVLPAQPYDPQQQVYLEGYSMSPLLNSTMSTSMTPSMASALSMGPSSSVSPYILRQQQAVPFARPMLSSSPVSTMLNPNQVQCAGQNDSSVINANNSNNNSFRLHQNNASSSRLDPPLELKNTLTNWGLTYKAGHMSRSRRTWENGTFIKSEMDLVNQPDVVPHAPSEQDQVRPSGCIVNSRRFHADIEQSEGQTGTITDDSSYEARSDPTPYQGTNEQESSGESISYLNHQQSPPKDPASSALSSTLVKQRQLTSGGSQFIVDDVGQDQSSNGITREMEAKREAFLARTLRRREQLGQKAIEIEAKKLEERQAELEKQKAVEQRKKERELNRQRALEAYKKKKMDRELEMSGSNRGHSQPPAARPKSTVDMSRSHTLQRPSRTQSSVGESNGSSSARSTISSIAEPSLKLYSKYVPKSNRTIIINALQYSVFPGAVWDKQRNEVLSELAKNDSKHLLLLFKDQKCRYLGAYSWDQQSDAAHRIHGKGPSICHESMMFLMFKYDSGAKNFLHIPTKHLSATIDGFTLKDQYMQSGKIPHSNSSYSGFR